jgi:hypothetical protein
MVRWLRSSVHDEPSQKPVSPGPIDGLNACKRQNRATGALGKVAQSVADCSPERSAKEIGLPQRLTENSDKHLHTTRHSRESGNPGPEIGAPALDPRFREGDDRGVARLGPFFGQILYPAFTAPMPPLRPMSKT